MIIKNPDTIEIEHDISPYIFFTINLYYYNLNIKLIFTYLKLNLDKMIWILTY